MIGFHHRYIGIGTLLVLASACGNPGTKDSEKGAKQGSEDAVPGSDEAAAFDANFCQSVGNFICKVEQNIALMVNNLRGANLKITLDGKISVVARLWSKEQSTLGADGQGQATHGSGFPTARHQAYIAQFGNTDVPIFISENVGLVVGTTTSYSPDALAKLIFDAWASNPTDRANMVKGGYTSMGIGIHHRRDSNTYFVTQLFAIRQ